MSDLDRPTAPLPPESLPPASEVASVCQRAEDYARAIPHLSDYLSEDELDAFQTETVNLHQEAIKLLFQGRLSVNPASIYALTTMAYCNMFELFPTDTIGHHIHRAMSLLLHVRGPAAKLEMLLEAKALQDTQLTDLDGEPRVPIGFAPPSPKKPTLH